MKITDDNITVDTVAILPKKITCLLWVDAILVLGIGCMWQFRTINEIVLVAGLIFSLALLIVIGIIAERHIEFTKQVYIEYLKFRKTKIDSETQNSKLSETLLKLWEHHEDCKGKSLQVTMVMSDTQLSC